MISQKRICNHKRQDEQYFCLEESCLQNQDYKLGCLKCIQDSHQHYECIQHIEEILQDAQRNQKTFLDKFEENLTFCQTIKRQLEKDTGQIKQIFSGWIEKQQKSSLQQIEQYEFTLNEHKQKFSSVQLSSDNLKTLVDFNLYNSTSFQQQNQEIKQILEQNQLEFTQYFNVLFERLFVNHDPHKRLNGFQIQITKNNKKSMKFEQCTEIGCNNQKNKFCLEQTCLQNHCIFECPSCQTSRHHIENKQSHRQFIVSANELWDQQNNRIDELEIFCDNQGKQIKKESLELQGTITECLIQNERKLKQFRQFVQSKENEILNKLHKFKSYYQKDQLVIFKELFLEKDLSLIAADFQQFLETLKGILINFKKQYQQQEKFSIEQEIQTLEDQWTQGFYVFQLENQLCDKNEAASTVGKKIQSMREQIISLTEKNQEYQIKIEQLTSDLISQKDQESSREKLFVFEKKIKDTLITNLNQELSCLENKSLNNQKMTEELKAYIKNEVSQFDYCILEKINSIEKSITNINAQINCKNEGNFIEQKEQLQQIIEILTKSTTQWLQNTFQKILLIVQNQYNAKQNTQEQQKKLQEKIDNLQNTFLKHQEIVKQNNAQIICQNEANLIEQQKKIIEKIDNLQKTFLIQLKTMQIQDEELQRIQLCKIEGIEQNLIQLNERQNQQQKGWLHWK